MVLHHAIEIIHRDGLLQLWQQPLFFQLGIDVIGSGTQQTGELNQHAALTFAQQAQHAVSLLLILLGHTFPYV